MMSKSSSSTLPKKKHIDDSRYEHEQQYVLRMPLQAAETLREEVVTGSSSLPHNISIEMLPDGRRALIRYGHYIYNANLVDLPCIIESMKTVDRKSFYKTAGISQMLVCTEEEDFEEPENLSKKDREKKYTWSHGITPPLKNVRRRRFRKTLTKKYNEQPDIEKEVRQLFRMDSEAIDVKWELVTEESTAADGLSQNLETGEASLQADGRTGLADVDLFGELSTSEDEEKDEKETSVGNERHRGGPAFSNTPRTMSQSDEMKIAQERELLEMRLEETKGELESLNNQRMAQENQMATIDNPALKHHFQEILDKLTDELNAKELQYERLLSE